MTESKVPAAIRVDWWYGETFLEGEEELRAELADSYVVSIVRPRRGGLGGGLYQLSSSLSHNSPCTKSQR